MDSLFAGINLIISIMIMFNMNEYKSLRVLQVAAGLVIWFKALYYLQLNDHISPLVSIIFKIFGDIVPFMVTLIVFIIAFSSAFWLLGRNQVEFD